MTGRRITRRPGRDLRRGLRRPAEGIAGGQQRIHAARRDGSARSHGNTKCFHMETGGAFSVPKHRAAHLTTTEPTPIKAEKILSNNRNRLSAPDARPAHMSLGRVPRHCAGYLKWLPNGVPLSPGKEESGIAIGVRPSRIPFPKHPRFRHKEYLWDRTSAPACRRRL